MMQYTIRIWQGETSLLPAINYLLAQLNPQHRTLQVERLTQLADADYFTLFLAFSTDEELIGIASLLTLYSCMEKKGIIEDVVVDKNYRQQGIAQALISKIQSCASEKNIAKLCLTSNPQRIAANQLYQKLQFQLYNTNVYHYHYE